MKQDKVEVFVLVSINTSILSASIGCYIKIHHAGVVGILEGSPCPSDIDVLLITLALLVIRFL